MNQTTSAPEHTLVPVVDSHRHLWDLHHLPWNWVRGAGLPTEDLFEESEPLPSVLVEAGVDVGYERAELEWLLDIAERNDKVLGIIASLPHGMGATQDTMSALADTPRVAGVRHNLQELGPGELASRDVVGVIAAVHSAGLPFDVCVRAHQLVEVTHMLRMLDTDGTLVLDHLGKPPLGQDLTRWRDDIATLAADPRVVVKCSGLVAEMPPPYQPQRARSEPATEQSSRTVLTPEAAELCSAPLRFALRNFGHERVMLGSDAPVSGKGWVRPRDCIQFQIQLLKPDLAGPALESIASLTAQRIYGLSEQTATATSATATNAESAPHSNHQNNL